MDVAREGKMATKIRFENKSGTIRPYDAFGKIRPVQFGLGCVLKISPGQLGPKIRFENKSGTIRP